jgi:hypothetical protein
MASSLRLVASRHFRLSATASKVLVFVSIDGVGHGHGGQDGMLPLGVEELRPTPNRSDDARPGRHAKNVPENCRVAKSRALPEASKGVGRGGIFHPVLYSSILSRAERERRPTEARRVWPEGQINLRFSILHPLPPRLTPKGSRSQTHGRHFGNRRPRMRAEWCEAAKKPQRDHGRQLVLKAFSRLAMGCEWCVFRRLSGQPGQRL